MLEHHSITAVLLYKVDIDKTIYSRIQAYFENLNIKTFQLEIF